MIIEKNSIKKITIAVFSAEKKIGINVIILSIIKYNKHRFYEEKHKCRVNWCRLLGSKLN